MEDEPPCDAHLSLRWENRDGWEQISRALSCPRSGETLPAVALALTVEATGAGRWVSYSRRREHYAMPPRYRSRFYTYDQIVPGVDWLDQQRLIDHVKAEPGTRGRQSIMRATPELLELMHVILDGNIAVLAPREPVILRDGEKRPIDYRDTGETHRMRRQINEQNEAIIGADIGGVNVHQLRAPLRRIFNGKLSRGGRFYAEGGGWQTLRKAERLQVTIAGEPVVEIDYSQFHPTLAYAQAGHRVPEDAYAIPSFDRGLVKIAFNVMLNSRCRNGARHTIAHKPGMVRKIIGNEIPEALSTDAMWGEAERLHPGYAQTATREAEHLIETILTKHAPIATMFFTGLGLSLQRLDSDIAEAVMQEMRRQGVVVLPIHDSFLAPASKAGILEGVMRDEAAKFGATVLCKRSQAVPIG